MSQEELNNKSQKGVNIQNQKNEGLKEEQRLGQAILDTLQRRVGTDEDLVATIRENNTILADQAKILKRNTTSKSLIKKLSNEIVSISERSYTILEDELGFQKTEERILKDQESLEKKILSLQSLKNEQLSDNAEIDADIKREIGLQIKASAKLSEQLEKIKNQSKEVADNLSVKSFGGLSDIFSKIPGLSRFSGPFQEAAEASREQAAFNLKNFDTTKGASKELRKSSELFNKMGSSQKANTLEALKSGKGLNKEMVKSLGLEKQLGNLTGTAAKEKLKALKINEKTLSGGVKAITPFKAGFKALGPIIKKALGPIGLILTAVDIIKFFVRSMVQASKATAEFSRNMLLSREASRELYSKVIPGIVGQYNELAAEQGKITILAADYEKTLGDINSQLGFQLNLAQDFGEQVGLNVAEAAMLQKQFGLSAEATTRLFQDATRLGQPLQDYTKEIFGQVGLLSTEAGLMADMNGVIEEASKISGNLRANFGGTVDALAAAVYQSRLLGLSLQESENAGSKLLNFEQSIADELEAELILGKNLNLEKAREAALMGDTETLMKEISLQAGTQEDFLNMNVYQRQSLAKAIGLEINQLADMFQKQADNAALQQKNLEVQNKLKEAGVQLQYDENGAIVSSLQEIKIASKAAGKSEKEIRKILGEQIYLRKQEQDATQRFNEALAQAKEAFSRLVDGGALDALVDILRGITDSALFSGYKAEGARRRAQEELVQGQRSGEVSSEQATSLQAQIDRQETLNANSTGFIGMLMDVVRSGTMGAMGPAVNALADMAREANQSAIDQQLGLTSPTPPTSTQPNSDFISRPGQPIQRFRKDDIIIGATNPLQDKTTDSKINLNTVLNPQPPSISTNNNNLFKTFSSTNNNVKTIFSKLIQSSQDLFSNISNVSNKASESFSSNVSNVSNKASESFSSNVSNVYNKLAQSSQDLSSNIANVSNKLAQSSQDLSSNISTINNNEDNPLNINNISDSYQPISNVPIEPVTNITTPSSSPVYNVVNNNTTPPSPSPTIVDNSKVEQLLERLISSVEKGGTINMDGNKVGTILGMASYKTQ